MTDDFQIDVGGFWSPEEKDEFEIIRQMSHNFGELLIMQIKLARELGPAAAQEAPQPKQLSFWQKLKHRLRR